MPILPTTFDIILRLCSARNASSFARRRSRSGHSSRISTDSAIAVVGRPLLVEMMLDHAAVTLRSTGCLGLLLADRRSEVVHGCCLSFLVSLYVVWRRLGSALDVTICGGAPRRRPSCWLFVADRLWGSLVPSQRAPACSRAAFARVNQASRAPCRTALLVSLTTCKLVNDALRPAPVLATRRRGPGEASGLPTIVLWGCPSGLPCTAVGCLLGPRRRRRALRFVCRSNLSGPPTATLHSAQRKKPAASASCKTFSFNNAAGGCMHRKGC